MIPPNARNLKINMEKLSKPLSSGMSSYMVGLIQILIHFISCPLKISWRCWRTWTKDSSHRGPQVWKTLQGEGQVFFQHFLSNSNFVTIITYKSQIQYYNFVKLLLCFKLTALLRHGGHYRKQNSPIYYL